MSLGPRSAVVRLALILHGRRSGFVIAFPSASISIRRGSRKDAPSEKDFYLVPSTLGCFDQAFEDIESKPEGALEVLDFSVPGYTSLQKTRNYAYVSWCT